MVNWIKDETFLFNGGYLEREIEETILRIREHIDGMSNDYFTELSDDEILDDLLDSYEFSAPEIYEEGIDLANNTETKINVQGDRNRDIIDRNKPFYVPGHAYTFSIPCSGDKRFWYLRGSSGSINHPRGTVLDNEILITIETSDTDTANVKKIFDDQVKSINNFLPSIQQEINAYNSNLPSVISNFIRQRRERLGKVDEGIKSLGIPIRRIPNINSPFRIPKAKYKIKIKKQIIKKSTGPAESFLETKVFDSILSDIEKMALVIEQSPTAFESMGEESLRWLFMIPLNLQYDSATGETFNSKGKTDILIRDGGHNVFIAECKIWSGASSFQSTIDQILGYTTWRDTKIAILIFNRNKNLSSVINTIKEEIPKHDCFVKELDPKGETHFRYTFHHKDDEDKMVDLAVLLFDVPKSQ